MDEIRPMQLLLTLVGMSMVAIGLVGVTTGLTVEVVLWVATIAAISFVSFISGIEYGSLKRA